MKKLLFAAVISLPLLASCTGTTPTMQTIATDVDSIATSLAAASQSLQAGKVLTAAQTTTFDSALAQVQAISSKIALTPTTAAATPLVQQLASALNAAIGVLSTSALLPQPVPEILAAINIVLPVVEAQVGIAPTPVLGVSATYDSSLTNVQQAEAFLKAQADTFRSHIQ